MLKRKISEISKIGFISSVLTLSSMSTCFASDGVGTASAESLSSKLVSAVKSYGMPLGGGIVFAAIVFIAILIIINARKPKERAETMSALGWVAGGALILGGALLIAGVIMGASSSMK